MQIVTFSNSNCPNTLFNDEKISLRKLSQVKALSNVQYYQQRSDIKPLQVKKLPRQSHIKWVGEAQPSSLIKANSQNKQTVRQVGKSPKRAGRRKIFQSKQHSSKENISIPTFSRVPLTNIQPHQQTQYYSMMVNSPRQRNNKLLGSKVNESKQYNSPFITNVQNSKIQRYNPSMMMSSNNFANGIDRSSITQLTEYHIPKLEQKLKQHDQQLSTIKKYIKNTQKLQNLKDSIKQFQQIQNLTIKQDEIQHRRLLLLNQIQSAKLRQAQLRKKSDQEANNTIQHIEQERLKRLEKIKKENQKLQQNLIQIDHLPSHSDIPDHYQDNIPDHYQNHIPDYYQDQYKFQGPIAFPSKDWDSQHQLIQPISKSFERSQHSRFNISYQKGYNTGDMELSPVMKKKMNEISSIGFSHNKTQSFSMEANTFRDFTSPLDFQGDNQLW